jgi:sulfur transfer complex TusBCD TusB component (DsrH family)
MTRQALNELMAILQTAPDVTFIRGSASQMAGRLLCEFEAPEQETLLRFLEAYHVTYEWIIRAEMRWEGQLTADTLTQVGGPPLQSENGTTEPKGVAQATAQGAVASTPAPSTTVVPTRVPQRPEEASAANILHILRNLKDESAWQIIQDHGASHTVAVLLMHDAVLGPPPLEVPMFACDADVDARGITSSLPRLTYDQIVELIFACERVIVW